MKKTFRNFFIKLSLLSICTLLILPNVEAQKMDRIERERFRNMLSNIKNAIKKDYFDPEFKGINLDERFKAAFGRLDQVATTGEALGVIAQALLDFDDSHLFY